MWITIISVAVAIIGTAFGIFIGLRSKQVFRPVLTFNNGLLYADQDAIPRPYKKVIKKAAISTLIYGANINQNSEVAFLCPYLMINNSKLPIYNITLQLQYASKYAIKNEEKIIGTIDKGMEYEVHVLGSPPEWYKYREVQILDSMAQIRYTIPVLRPGEKIVIPDPIKFTKFNHCGKLDNGDYGVNKELARKLREIRELCDFCVIDVFVYSESCPPLSKRIKLLWFDTGSAEELVSLTNDAIKAFWGGKWPKPGLYFHFRPWPIRAEIMVKEHGEAIIPKLKTVKISKERYFYWENPLESERNIVTFGVPSWNYYQLSPNIDHDDLILRSGFQRVISKEQMQKLRNIFKRLFKK